MRSFICKYWLLIISVLLYCLSVFPGALRGHTAFTYDSGRDMLAVYRMLYEHKFTLIGPTTGMPGVFHGAWAFYWLIIPFLIFGGHPTGVAIAVGIIGLCSLLLLYFLLSKTFSSKTAGVIVLIYALSREVSETFALIGHNNLVPFWIIVSFFSLTSYLRKRKYVYLYLFGLSSAFCLEFEFAFGLFIVPLNILFLLVLLVFEKKNLLTIMKNMGCFLLGTALPFFPRFLFDIRHGFFMTKNLLAGLFHSEVKFYLFRNMTLGQRIINRLEVFIGLWKKTLPSELGIFSVVILILICILIPFVYKKSSRKEQKPFLLFAAAFIIFLFACFTYYKDVIWGNYLTGFFLYYLVIVAACVHEIMKNQFGKRIIMLVMVFLFCLQFVTKEAVKPSDPSSIVNQLAVIDYIYADAGGNMDFSVGVFSPSWFSYPYDYWFIWREKFKGIKPPKSLWHTKINYLIAEPPDSSITAKQWFDRFMNKNAKLDSTKYFGRLKVEKWTL